LRENRSNLGVVRGPQVQGAERSKPDHAISPSRLGDSRHPGHTQGTVRGAPPHRISSKVGCAVVVGNDSQVCVTPGTSCAAATPSS
jgi:hypothetical protein